MQSSVVGGHVQGGSVRLEVLIPVWRPAVQRALYSLARQTEPPELVTLIGNIPHMRDLEPCGLPVRILRHTSEVYCYGLQDIALARNVGIWWAREPYVVCFDDDQVAPRTMLADLRARLADTPYVYGHYRYLDFAERSLDELLNLPPTAGRTREHPPNDWHLYYSGFSGLFACDTALLQSIGWDMVYNGSVPFGEDQNVAYRLTRAVGDEGRLFVHEPPFAWHPEGREAPYPAPVTNACSADYHDHAWGPEQTRFGVRWHTCTRCPYMRITHQDDPGRRMVIQAFDPRAVSVVETWL
jgi:hypothetical protein